MRPPPGVVRIGSEAAPVPSRHASLRHLGPPAMQVHFVIVSPATQKRSVPVRMPLLVGRADEAKFRIQQDSVSRRHCEFFIEDDAVFVRDLGSTNGTLLDDEEIPANTPTRVPPGAVVRVGSVAFRVDYQAAAAPAGEPAGIEDTVPLADPETLQPEAAEPEVAEPEAIAAEEAPETAFGVAAPADEPAAAGFDFLPGGEPAAPAADDDNLNDFFKSLS